MCMVTELLDGETLRARMDSGRLPQSKAIDFARQIASGLAAAHAKGITHRDIKPENVFVTRDELLAGTRPFAGDTAVQTMNAILTEDPPALVVPGRTLPPSVERVVRQCLEKNPEERFQSARDLAFASMRCRRPPRQQAAARPPRAASCRGEPGGRHAAGFAPWRVEAP